MSGIAEGVVEDACLDYFRALGFHTLYGPEIGPGGSAAERTAWDEVLLVGRLREAVARINPSLSAEAVGSVVATVLRAESQNSMAENFRLHRLATSGVRVEYWA